MIYGGRRLLVWECWAILGYGGGRRKEGRKDVRRPDDAAVDRKRETERMQRNSA
jgi:hypothetical protein